MSHPKNDAEKRAKVRELVNDIRMAIMVTRNADGSLHGRPMSTAQLDQQQWDTIWFATQRDSGKIDEVRDDDHVQLGYSSGGKHLCISGRAVTNSDRQKIKDLWSPLWKNWFSGPDDPNILLLGVKPDIAEYWDSGNRIFALAAMAAAAVTGKHVPAGENEKVAF